jgi:predicted phage terminase large subunit-like protein
LIADPTTVLTRGSSYENRRNLAKAFFSQIVRKYEGTRLGRQELNAEVLDDVPGALWTRELLEELRWPAGKRVPDLSRVVVAVDPAVTSGEEADETGIIVAGRDYDGRGYVLDDRSGRYAPVEWAREAVMLYRKYDADRVVAEVNNGGDMVEATLRMVDENVSFNAVRASRGKVVRAEPVAALYEQKRCFHVGSFPTLEDQMASFTSDFDRDAAGYSPDRVDSLVWAFSELLVTPMASYAAYEIAREQAEAVIARRKAEEEARRPKPSPAPGSMEYMELLKHLNWPR